MAEAVANNHMQHNLDEIDRVEREDENRMEVERERKNKMRRENENNWNTPKRIERQPGQYNTVTETNNGGKRKKTKHKKRGKKKISNKLKKKTKRKNKKRIKYT